MVDLRLLSGAQLNYLVRRSPERYHLKGIPEFSEAGVRLKIRATRDTSTLHHIVHEILGRGDHAFENS